MLTSTGKFALPRCAMIAFCSIVLASGCARAAGCDFEIQGEGRVADVIDARSFRLDDGREVRLIGIEPADKAKGRAALAALVTGREVILRATDDTPDRYGRQPALCSFRAPSSPCKWNF